MEKFDKKFGVSVENIKLLDCIFDFGIALYDALSCWEP
jgi:hypothetical protein